MGGLNPDARAALERIVAAVSLPVRNRARIGETEIEVGGPGGPTAGLGAALYAHFYIVPSPAPPPGPGGGGAFLAGRFTRMPFMCVWLKLTIMKLARRKNMMSINGMISIRACFFAIGERILMAKSPEKPR